MNSITIYGKVVSEPVYKSGSRTRTLDFTVAVQRPSRRAGGGGADFIPVRCWNQLADDLKDLKYGDRVLAQGRLRVGRNGECEVSAHDAWLPDYEDSQGGRGKTPKRPSGAAKKER